MSTMFRLLILLLALCVFLSENVVTTARLVHNLSSFVIQGRVYCDTCGFGFETRLSTDIAGAKVKVECRDIHSMNVVFTKEGVTGTDGEYTIMMGEDHQTEICEVALVSSPQKDCERIEPGLDRTRVILTNSSGIVSANSLAFQKDKAIDECSKII